MKKLGISLMLIIAISFTVNAYAQISLNEPVDKQAILSSLTSMPMVFTENRGQWGDKTLYKANASGATFYFCKDEVAYLFMRNTDELIEGGMAQLGSREGSGLSHDFQNKRPPYKKEAMLIHAKFIGANPNPLIIADERLPHTCNYFYGNNPANWRTGIPNSSYIVYKDIWQGIDLRYHGNGRGMKYDFIVNPGADISQIRIRYEGIEGLSVAPNGDLQMQTKFGPVSENIPLVYQESDDSKIELTGRYILIGPNTFGFEVDGYNRSQTLVIDPELTYSSYLGGSDYDIIQSIVIDSSGNVYVTGWTLSSDFPTINFYDDIYDGGDDAFVSKFNPAGDSLIYSTYLGGSDKDRGIDIAIDGSGSAYVIGYTWSESFPTVNAYDSTLDGGEDAFITKLSPEGDSLIYSTFLGGGSAERGWGIVTGSSGSAYVTGRTASGNFPTVNPYDNSYNGGINDAFVSKFAPAGNSLLYSTFLGGDNIDEGNNIAIDDIGNAYVIGITGSDNFPIVNPYDSSYNGGIYDAFVSKFSLAGDSLIYSTYLGGDDYDHGNDIALDDLGNVYVTGDTQSPDFPTIDAYDNTYNGVEDAFVSKLYFAGDSLIYSTYLGGIGLEWVKSIAVDGSGSVYVIGTTQSNDFPTKCAFDYSFNGGQDCYVTKFSPAGNSLIYSTYLGGNYTDQGLGIAVDNSGNALVTGYTTSDSFPMVNPYDGSLNGISDAFVAIIGPAECLFCDAESFSPVVPNMDGTIIWRMDVTNCGCSTPVYAEIYPTVGDCASGTQYDFNINRLAVNNLDAGDSTTIYYWYRPGTVTGVIDAAINIDVGPAIDNYISNCCFEFIFAYEFGRPGTEIVFGPGEWGERGEEPIIPTVTALKYNYPNPFNNTTNIAFDLSKSGDVNLTVYNLMGQKVEILVDGKMNAGQHNINWDASKYSSGVYFYKLTAAGEIYTKRMTLLK
ncbi:MAG: T9SS type A sorting domain-containing protein [candidate division Zixibacteria bacterium]|nr:T9SS type A sorting domain-containing protein [candidate division Zixibacteria bacterium]